MNSEEVVQQLSGDYPEFAALWNNFAPDMQRISDQAEEAGVTGRANSMASSADMLAHSTPFCHLLSG